MDALAGAQFSRQEVPSVNVEDHYSNFMFTGNTNWRPKSKDQAKQQAQWVYTVLRVFLTPRYISPAVRLAGSTRVKGLKITGWGVELGTNTKGQRIHFHAFLKFVHTGSMQLDVPMLKQQFLAAWNEALPTVTPPSNPYMNVKWYAATEELLKRYIYKQSMLRYNKQ